jgi:CRP-like cAMP-binding protein
MDLNVSRNLLIQRMSHEDRERLQSDFVEEPIALKQKLHAQDEPIEHVYFVESGVMSVVTDLADGDSVETAVIGNEGFVGLSAVFGVFHSSSRVFSQVAGRGLRVPADVMAAECAARTEWFRLLLRYAHFVQAMTAQHAACNRVHSFERRMSRWLLMTHDRVEGDEFTLTQQFLGHMLGVGSPTVVIAVATLQKAGFIQYADGRITVLDRAGLESVSCECYSRVRKAQDLIFDGHSVGD